ncbi:MAG: hypothetical protein AB1352_04485, partial [Patescibacteria group bacterium]
MINDRELIKKIKSTNWYRQGGAIAPYYSSLAYRAIFAYFGGFNYFQGEINYGYFDRIKEKKVCTRILQGVLKEKITVSIILSVLGEKEEMP